MEEKEKIKKMKNEAIKKGGVFARLYFQIFGTSEKATLDLAKGFSAALVKAEGVKLAAAEIAEVSKEGDYYATYIEAHMVFKDIKDLVELVLDTTPFSIEVIEPEELKLSNGKLTELMYTLSSYVFKLKTQLFETNPDKAKLINEMAKNRLKLAEEINKMLEKGENGSS